MQIFPQAERACFEYLYMPEDSLRWAGLSGSAAFVPCLPQSVLTDPPFQDDDSSCTVSFRLRYVYES